MDEIPITGLLMACAAVVALLLRPILAFLIQVVAAKADRKRPEKSSSRTPAVDGDTRWDILAEQVSEMHEWHSQVDPITAQPMRFLQMQQTKQLIDLNKAILEQITRQNTLLEQLITEHRNKVSTGTDG